MRTLGRDEALLKLLSPQPAPARWRTPCANTECTLHQLSPYIGKIKSSIAADLVERFSQPGDLVVDPFAGAGTIPFEAAIRGRRALGADISPYARILAQAKLCPPASLDAALALAEEALVESARLPSPDLRKVPAWVREFYHPGTLREALRFAEVCRRPGSEFLMACFLGILHHQRPGFLSYPSSHLVPYLRTRKFPRQRFPEMYAYRSLKPRLLAKVRRSYRRFVRPPHRAVFPFQQTPVEDLAAPRRFGALITSPPYMNALDYGRDNRLRLWFIDPRAAESVDNGVTQWRQTFVTAMSSLAAKAEQGLRPKGYCVYVVGDAIKRTFDGHPSEVVVSIMAQCAPSLRLKTAMADSIPDVRRSRHECKGVRIEHFLVFQRH
jgi:hypothetical protein